MVRKIVLQVKVYPTEVDSAISIISIGLLTTEMGTSMGEEEGKRGVWRILGGSHGFPRER